MLCCIPPSGLSAARRTLWPALAIHIAGVLGQRHQFGLVMERIERPHSVLVGQPQTRGYIGSARARAAALLYRSLRPPESRARRAPPGGLSRPVHGLWPILGGRPIHQVCRQFLPLPSLGAEVPHPVAYLLVLRNHLVGPILQDQALVRRLCQAGRQAARLDKSSTRRSRMREGDMTL